MENANKNWLQLDSMLCKQIMSVVRGSIWRMTLTTNDFAIIWYIILFAMTTTTTTTLMIFDTTACMYVCTNRAVSTALSVEGKGARAPKFRRCCCHVQRDAAHKWVLSFAVCVFIFCAFCTECGAQAFVICLSTGVTLVTLSDWQRQKCVLCWRVSCCVMCVHRFLGAVPKFDTTPDGRRSHDGCACCERTSKARSSPGTLEGVLRWLSFPSVMP